MNGKRPQVLLPHAAGPEECYTAAHEENVRFVYEGAGGSGGPRGALAAGPGLTRCPLSPAWQEVEQQLDDSQRGESARGPVQYVEKTPDPSLKCE